MITTTNRRGSGLSAVPKLGRVKPLTGEDWRKLTSAVINGNSTAAELMMVLADEMERLASGESPSADVGDACDYIRNAAIYYHTELPSFARQITERRRALLTGVTGGGK